MVNSQKLIQLSPRSHPRHLVGKRTAQKDAIKDITRDSQVNSLFPYRWSPASLTISIYFNLFLYLYITRITINNNTSKITLKPKQKSRLGMASNKIAGGGGGGVLQLVCGRPTLVLSSALVPQTLVVRFAWKIFISYMDYLRNIEIKDKTNMRTHRNSNTVIPERKKPTS